MCLLQEKRHYFDIGYDYKRKDALSRNTKDLGQDLPKFKSLFPFVGGLIFKSYDSLSNSIQL